jgi:hypothetical protein
MARRSLCDSQAKRGHLMCPRCWYLVPRDLRDRINELWAASGRNIMNLSPEYFDAVRQAEDAVQASMETA